MTAKIRYSLIILIAAGLIGGCNPASPQPPEAVVKAVLTAAEQQDWGTADQYLTQRLSAALQPGSLPRAWQNSGKAEIVQQKLIGRTANVWIQSKLTPAEAAQIVGLDAPTLTRWLKQPPTNDSGYDQFKPRLAGMQLSGDQVSSTLKLTLYQQSDGWKIEVWQPELAPAK